MFLYLICFNVKYAHYRSAQRNLCTLCCQGRFKDFCHHLLLATQQKNKTKTKLGLVSVNILKLFPHHKYQALARKQESHITDTNMCDQLHTQLSGVNTFSNLWFRASGATELHMASKTDGQEEEKKQKVGLCNSSSNALQFWLSSFT